MKSFITAILISSAAIVGAQISALPPCGITCGLQAANATNCSPITNFNCTCQYSNQALILPVLASCLAKSCDNAAQSSAAISAGEGICATISQTASSLASYGTSAMSTPYPTASAASSTIATSSASPSASASASASATAQTTASTSSTYTGAAAMVTAGVEAVAAVAGMAMLVL